MDVLCPLLDATAGKCLKINYGTRIYSGKVSDPEARVV